MNRTLESADASGAKKDAFGPPGTVVGNRQSAMPLQSGAVVNTKTAVNRDGEIAANAGAGPAIAITIGTPLAGVLSSVATFVAALTATTFVIYSFD